MAILSESDNSRGSREHLFLSKGQIPSWAKVRFHVGCRHLCLRDLLLLPQLVDELGFGPHLSLLSLPSPSPLRFPLPCRRRRLFSHPHLPSASHYPAGAATVASSSPPATHPPLLASRLAVTPLPPPLPPHIRPTRWNTRLRQECLYRKSLALSSSAGALTLSAFVEPLVIFLILVVNAAVGVWQETNDEKALEALRQIQSSHAAVLRDGEWASALPLGRRRQGGAGPWGGRGDGRLRGAAEGGGARGGGGDQEGGARGGGDQEASGVADQARNMAATRSPSDSASRPRRRGPRLMWTRLRARRENSGRGRIGNAKLARREREEDDEARWKRIRFLYYLLIL
ncbi:uncharacterized protein LOC119350180 [Triticum dicoccoides]|uniref:uncharacterized protein LOC119350180 n=1 Tax=Triticum dicoccoides TaxID=85692 RepID=UPI00188E2A54|nr:uncharacterized protein LOC119350180 [Triticum dicoccoides]